MKKFICVNLLSLLCCYECVTLTPAERTILDDAASRAINTGLNRIGPPAPVHPAK